MASPVKLSNEIALAMGKSLFEPLNQNVNISPAGKGSIPTPIIQVIRNTVVENYKTAILKSVEGEANNATTTFYTVPTGKSYLLTNIHIGVGSDGTGNLSTTTNLTMTTPSPNSTSMIWRQRPYTSVAAINEDIVFSPNLLLPAGSTFSVQSNGIHQTIDASILGYEIDNSDVLTAKYPSLS